MFKSVAPFMFIAVFVASCAKERPYEEDHGKKLNRLYGAEYSKSQMDFCAMEDPCLWVPSVADTPYNVSASRPYWQGEAKLVVTQMTENKLRILQIEEDERFNSNINNFSPVAEFDIRHVDYTCQEDSLGECSNREIEDTEKPWMQRRYLRLNNFSVTEKNSLPIQFSQLFQAGCYNATDSYTLGNDKFKLENGALNVRMKVSYDANPNCVMLREMDDLRYLNFTVDYHYSLVKLSQIADNNYAPVNYPSEDQNTFGFFKTVKKNKTVDNHDHYMGLKDHLVNRWSPNRKEVVYYLNADFYKPEMKKVLESTQAAVATVNNSLRLAKANFQIVLKDGRDKEIGDIRNNFLVLVSDPQASGVIGYGPSVANPLTGEILSARTVMYHGTIKKFISSTYDELYDHVMANLDNKTAAAAEVAEKSAPKAGMEEGAQLDAQAARLARPVMPGNFLRKANNIRISEFRDLERLWARQVSDLIRLPMNMADALTPQDASESLKRFQERMDLLSKQTFYHNSYLNLDDSVTEFIKATRRTWDELTEEERDSIIDSLLPGVWVSTLVHEIGHNLGLRHNFNGNIDEENFYTKEERVAMGIKRDIKYSSVMDYAFSPLNELPIMGKYDVAALRFAYAREVETNNGQTLKIDRDLDTLISSLNNVNSSKNDNDRIELKRYKYCTDEDVPYSSLCNRHDVGRNYTEIVSHYIEQYKKNYEKVNFRNRRYDFSGEYGDWNYAIRTLNVMGNVRIFFDRYDQRVFQGDYERSDLSETRKKELKDLEQASDLAFNFLMDVIETPAYHCLETIVKDGQITGFGRVAPFSEMAKGTTMEEYGITFDIVNGCDYLTYFESQKPDPDLGPGESKIYLSFGKYFNNSLDISIPYADKLEGDSSQMDVRGFWFDKLVAGIYLTSRSQSPTTIGAASNGSFLDYPKYRERFENFARGLLNNKFEKEVEVSQGGMTLGTIKVPYSFEGNHLVNKSYNMLVNYVFGLENTQTNLKTVLLNHMKKNFKVPESPTDYSLLTYHEFDATRLNIRSNVDDYEFDKVVEFKDQYGRVTSRFGLYDYNTYGMELAEKKEALDKMMSLGAEEMEELFETIAALNAATTVEEQNAVVQAVENKTILDVIFNHGALLQDFLNGTLNQDSLASSFFALSEEGDSIF